TLLEARLAAHTGNPGEIRTKAQELADSIPLAQAVGDLDSLSALARALGDLLADPELRRRYARAGRRRYVEQFTARRMAEETLGVYEQVLARAGAGGASVRTERRSDRDRWPSTARATR
uniref:glycosyltransferase family protein n=1 Tax=Modestobacter sp. KNN46-3 TaxID=2711218 RepID=UPI0013E02925